MLHGIQSGRSKVREVTEGDRGTGAQIRARRERHGISQQALAEMAHVSRTTLRALEDGRVSPQGSTVGKVLAALDAFEEEAGATLIREEPSGVVTYRLNRSGIEVTLQGPVDNIPELEASIERLLSKLEDDS